MENNKLYYFCESGFIAQKIKETAKLMTSNDVQRAPNGKRLRFVTLKRRDKNALKKEKKASPAIILDENALRERYRLAPFSPADLLKDAPQNTKVKYIAAYEDGNYYANVLASENQFTVPINENLYQSLKRQILDMGENEKEKYNLEIFGRAKAKSKGSFRTEMLKFNVRRGGLKLSPEAAHELKGAKPGHSNDEFRIWTDADTVDISGCILD